jgi:hypothetical protein
MTYSRFNPGFQLFFHRLVTFVQSGGGVVKLVRRKILVWIKNTMEPIRLEKLEVDQMSEKTFLVFFFQKKSNLIFKKWFLVKKPQEIFLFLITWV